LHREGLAVLEPYDVVLTGSHAEYWSGEMLDATSDYLSGGGKLMYLSGNGLFVVTQLDPELGHTIEIRRFGVSGQWFAGPGERHLSTTGEHGGLWRERGRTEHRLVGVGFVAVGPGPGRPFERQPGSFDPRAAFIFEGIAADELIGDFPSLINGYGAAAYEIDRLNHDLGSSREAIVLATATGFSGYVQILEQWSYADSFDGPSAAPTVRADMVYVEYPNGGAVFSASSIGWCGCLSYNNYDNNVSRITRNVLNQFAS
jgi:N,N-dimethylformamidase